MTKPKQLLRLQLPPLDSLTKDSTLRFVLLERGAQIARAGESSLGELASSLGHCPVQAVLAPADAVFAEIRVPPVAARRLGAVVASALQPMVLGDVAQLGIAHGPRRPDGLVAVAWAQREALARAGELLRGCGLQVRALLPWQAVFGADESKAEWPPGAAWQAPWPQCSFGDARARASSGAGQGLRRPLLYLGLAAALWLLGLNIYAAQQRARLEFLRLDMQAKVEQAFPQISVVIDPLRQAQQQLDALRLANGAAASDDFLPLAAAAAQVLQFAQGAVQRLQFDAGVLALELLPGQAQPAPLDALNQAAAAAGLELYQDAQHPEKWQLKKPAANEGQP